MNLVIRMHALLTSFSEQTQCEDSACDVAHTTHLLTLSVSGLWAGKKPVRQEMAIPVTSEPLEHGKD